MAPSMQPPPLSVIESWPAPNYINPETRGNANVILNIVLYSLLLFFISLRIFTRTYLRSSFGADDVFILLALIPATAFFVISVLADVKFLWIRHVYDIPLSHVVTGLKMVLSTEVVFAAACTLTKLSMLMLVRRMLSSATLFWRRITWLAISICAIQGSVFILTVIFQCRPPQDYWKVTQTPDSNCINQTWSLLVAGVVNALTDLIAVLLPIRTVWTLQLPARQVAIVVLLFSLGFVSCIAGIIRTYFMYRVTSEYDQTWNSYPVWITSAVELYIGMICASIPATKPFFTSYLPHVFGALATVPSHVSQDSRQRAQRSTHTVVITANHHDQEMLTYNLKALEAGKSGTSSMASRTDSRSDSEEDWIRVTQTVGFAKEEQ
ncbi:hypothetical protein V8E51_010192 [Hyaloscypha variabilis]